MEFENGQPLNLPCPDFQVQNETATIYKALVLGTRDYVRKTVSKVQS